MLLSSGRLPSSPPNAGFDLVRIRDQSEDRRVVDKTLDRLELLVGEITFDLNLYGDLRHAAGVGLGPLDLEQHAGIEVARNLGPTNPTASSTSLQPP